MREVDTRVVEGAILIRLCDGPEWGRSSSSDRFEDWDDERNGGGNS